MATEAEIFRVWDYGHPSGKGSEPSEAQPYIDFVSGFIRERGVETVCDLGCGDFEVGSRIDYGSARVTAVDASARHIGRHRGAFIDPRFTFVHADVRAFDDFRFDLALAKDVLQHWSTADIQEWLLRPHARLLLATDDVWGGEVNGDLAYVPAEDGQLRTPVRGLDLREPPFRCSGSVVLEYGGKSGKRTLLMERD